MLFTPIHDYIHYLHITFMAITQHTKLDRQNKENKVVFTPIHNYIHYLYITFMTITQHT